MMMVLCLQLFLARLLFILGVMPSYLLHDVGVMPSYLRLITNRTRLPDYRIQYNANMWWIHHTIHTHTKQSTSEQYPLCLPAPGIHLPSQYKEIVHLLSIEIHLKVSMEHLQFN